MGLYLGLPEQIGGSKRRVFAYVQDRLNTRINNWSAKFLSKGGKEVLIKSVAQALPTYVMSCFLLPKDIIRKLRSAISNFWWSSTQEKKGMHWLAWDKLCLPQDRGGLGFRDLYDFNIALLAKQLWRLIQYPSSLLARVLRGRYFNQSNPLDERRIYSPSYGWRSIIAARPLLKQGLRKTIGSGFNTFVWSEPWIPDIPARLARGHPLPMQQRTQMRVHELINQNTKEWDIQLLHELFLPEDISLILGLRPSKNFTQDGYAWSFTKSGVYTVKSGYELSQMIFKNPTSKEVLEPSTTCLNSHVWKVQTSSKLKHFMWQALSGCIATGQRLVHRHLGTDMTCPRCGDPEETVNHLLFECPPALQVWALSDFPSRPGFFPSSSLFQNMDFLFWRIDKVGLTDQQKHIYPWILWYIWKARNDLLFNGKNISPLETLHVATLEAEVWSTANQRDIVTVNARVDTTFCDLEPNIPICHIDASWVDNGQVSGIGWYLKVFTGQELFGARGCRKCLSALHAEMEGLLWAMLCLREKQILEVRFATDCSDLLKMIDEPMDWPAFRSDLDFFSIMKEDFRSFSLILIPRTENVRADSLARGARTRGLIFSYVDHFVPVWIDQRNQDHSGQV